MERLEDRVLLAAITWVNPTGDSWHNAANWDLNRVPEPGDTVTIPELAGDQSIVISTSVSGIRSITCNEQLVLSASLSGVELLGTFKLSGFNAILNGASVSGSVQIGGSSRLIIENGLTVNGSLYLGQNGQSGTLLWEGNHSIVGSGTIQFGPGEGMIIASSEAAKLTIAEGVTLRGGNGKIGQVLQNGQLQPFHVVNNGTIQSDQNSIEIQSSIFESPGRLLANSGTQILIRSRVENSGQTLHMAGSGEIRLIAATIVGGTIQVGANVSFDAGLGNAIVNQLTDVTVNGRVTISGNAGFNNPCTSLEGVTINGQVSVVNNAIVSVLDGISINGLLEVGSANSSGSFRFEGTQAISGSGVVRFVGSDEKNSLLQMTDNATLILGPGITVEGETGWLGVNRSSGNVGSVGCDLRNAHGFEREEVYAKRGVLPENVGSHTNNSGKERLSWMVRLQQGVWFVQFRKPPFCAG